MRCLLADLRDQAGALHHHPRRVADQPSPAPAGRPAARCGSPRRQTAQAPSSPAPPPGSPYCASARRRQGKPLSVDFSSPALSLAARAAKLRPAPAAWFSKISGSACSPRNGAAHQQNQRHRAPADRHRRCCDPDPAAPGSKTVASMCELSGSITSKISSFPAQPPARPPHCSPPARRPPAPPAPRAGQTTTDSGNPPLGWSTSLSARIGVLAWHGIGQFL